MKKINLLKQIFILIIALSTVITACSCGGSEQSSVESGNKSESSTSSVSEVSAETNSSADNSSVSNEADYGYTDVGEVKLRIFKTGKGDAFLFRTSSKTVLIDMTDIENGVEVVDFLAEKGIKQLDYILITHLDKNNIGGAPTILNQVDVKSVYAPVYTKDSDTYASYKTALSEAGLKQTDVTQKTSLTVDDLEITIYPCEKEYYADDDNYTCAISVKHKSISFLFVGDAKDARIDELVKLPDIKHDFLMIPDNGLYGAGSEKLITAVQPAYAAITCSAKNPADNDMLTLLASKNVSVYQTLNGSVKMTSDGTKLDIVQ